MEVPVNYPAVVVAALANYLIGAIWYAAIFRRPWQRLSGMSQMKLTAVGVILALVGAVLTSYILAHLIVFAGAYMRLSGVRVGLTTGFFNWLGFVAPVTLGVVIYEKKSWKLWLLNNGYWLLSLLVMGIILSAWK
jgi:hypothetical protein